MKTISKIRIKVPSSQMLMLKMARMQTSHSDLHQVFLADLTRSGNNYTVYIYSQFCTESRCEVNEMSQDDEVWLAFREAMKRDNSGLCTVSTRDFVAELEQRNSPHTLRAANTWIEMHITTFSDISIEDGEWRLFQVPAAHD